MAFLNYKISCKSYFLGKEEFPVLKGIDLEFELGEFVSEFLVNQVAVSRL